MTLPAIINTPPPLDLAVRTIHLNPAAVPAIMRDVVGVDLLAKRDKLVADSSCMTAVEDATDYGLAMDMASQHAGIAQKIEAICKPVTDILYKMHRASTGAREELTARSIAEKNRLTSISTKWRQEEERKRAEEAARIQREEEERRRDEQAEADRLAQEEAERLAAEGRVEEAEAVIDQRVQEAEVEAFNPIPIVLPTPVLPVGMKTPGAIKTNWKYCVMDLKVLVQAAAASDAYMPYVQANDGVIGALVRAQKAQTCIPGVDVYAEESTTVRAAK